MLHQLYQKQVEAWKEDYCRKHHRAETLVAGHLSNGVVEPWSAEALLSSRQKDTIELLEAEIERKRGMRKDWPYKPNKKTGEIDFGKYPSSVCRSCGQNRQAELQGYNQCLDEDIAYLEEELRKLKNEQ